MKLINAPLFWLACLLFCASCGPQTPTVEQIESSQLKQTEDSLRSERLIYGLNPENFLLKHGKIGQNEFLADILNKHAVSFGEVQQLANKAKDIYSVRKLRAGQEYTLFCTKDSVEKACYFIFETAPADYVVYDLTDSMKVYTGQKEVKTRLAEASGVVSSSLYQTIADNDLHYLLAPALADMYAWTVDFYRIQKGDFFKVIYEEKYVDGKPFGIGRIHAAVFGHKDQLFYGFAFAQDSILDYFDEKGESLRKAFLKAPLQFSRISSRFSLKRYHPVQKRWKAHLGTDYAAPAGTPILATGDGTVIASAYGKYNGNYVKIKHNSTYTTQYLHMSKRAVRNGQFVRQGEVIGYVGSTGLATGPHVCYRFWKNGKQVDPYRQELPASEPLKPAYEADFNSLKDSLIVALEEIPMKAGTELVAEK